MKKIVTSVFLLFVILLGCTNRDGEIIDLINSVKKQNDDLKAQITSLKKTTDSAMVAITKVTVSQAVTDKKLDAIQTELKSVLAQISSLSAQMTTANADLASIKTKIDALQVKCAELVAQIGTLTTTLNSTLVDLKKQVESLKNTSDSALTVIAKLSSAQASSDKNIVSIQAELKNVLSQIVDLSSQLGASNVDITSLKSRIDALQLKVNELVIQINMLNPANNLKNGLVAYYPFNGNAKDASPNGYNGIVNGPILTTDRNGNINQAYLFGDNQDISLPNTSSLNTYPISVSLWYNTNKLSDGEASNIFSKYTPANWNGFQILLTDNRNVANKNDTFNDGFGVQAFYLRSNNDRVLGYYNEDSFSQKFISKDTWYHFVFVLDKTGGKIYVNGILKDSHVWTGNEGPSNNSLLWKIGGYYNTWYNGKIDDVGVWNRVLTVKEIKYLYENDFNL